LHIFCFLLIIFSISRRNSRSFTEFGHNTLLQNTCVRSFQLVETTLLNNEGSINFFPSRILRRQMGILDVLNADNVLMPYYIPCFVICLTTVSSSEYRSMTTFHVK